MEAKSLAVISSSLFHTISRMVEEENNNSNNQMSIEHTNVIELVPRLTGIITLISSFCMVWMAWSRRRQLFHRLVLGIRNVSPSVS
mmetsp:Transcript_36635/g.42118  ORF Transcript_36635/g.42118 Transcript_36635/m.42118 type:complete len:86 (-) Transcript_36635:49-306(-)